MRSAIRLASMVFMGLLSGHAMAAAAVMRLHHTAPPNHHVTMALQLFAQDVAERTDGRVVVDVVTKRTGRPVIEPDQYLAALKAGDIEAISQPTFMWEQIPEMTFSEIPYYFTSLEQVKGFPHSKAAGVINRKLAGLGVELLAWMHVTRTSVFTSKDKPVLHPDDLVGKKIAALNTFGQVIFKPLTSEAPIIYSPLVPKAAASGEVDVVMTDVASAVGLKLYEAHRYGTVMPFFSAYYVVAVSPQWLASLPAKDRKALKAAARKLEENSVVITEARGAAAPDMLREGGMSVHMQTPEEAAEWRERLQPQAIAAFEALSPETAQFLRQLDSNLRPSRTH